MSLWFFLFFELGVSSISLPIFDLISGLGLLSPFVLKNVEVLFLWVFLVFELEFPLFHCLCLI